MGFLMHVTWVTCPLTEHREVKSTFTEQTGTQERPLPKERLQDCWAGKHYSKLSCTWAVALITNYMAYSHSEGLQNTSKIQVLEK